LIERWISQEILKYYIVVNVLIHISKIKRSGGNDEQNKCKVSLLAEALFLLFAGKEPLLAGKYKVF